MYLKLLVVAMMLSTVAIKRFAAAFSRIPNVRAVNRQLERSASRYTQTSRDRPDFENKGSSPYFQNRSARDGPPQRRANNPFARLNFQKTIKIDPSQTTPVADLKVSEITKTFLLGKGFEALTPVQSQSFDVVYEGKDVVARSRTGTGKTFAFGLPLIEKLVAEGLDRTRCEARPLVLILEPTRELTVQVAEELASLCRKHRMRVEAIFGGSPFGVQISGLNRGVHFLVATPGRLLDHISKGTVDLSGVRTVVLDEGDTMLEMGFQQDVEEILRAVKSEKNSPDASELEEYNLFNNQAKKQSPTTSSSSSSPSSPPSESRQMLLYSATMPSWICNLTDELMQSPVFLDAVQEGETRLAQTITHYALQLPDVERMMGIQSFVEDLILTKGNSGQTIVFTDTKQEANDLIASGCFGSLKTQVLHGDIGQDSRQATIRMFKEKNLDVLVATDVAARGLDIAGVELVVHTAPPRDSNQYVHRSGRTGRAGRTGVSVVFYGNRDTDRLRALQRELNFKFLPAKVPSTAAVVEASAQMALKRLSNVDDDVSQVFSAHADTILQQAMSGKLFQLPAVVTGEDGNDEEGNCKPLTKDEAMRLLTARALAVISNRMSISCRSLLTGAPNQMSLLVKLVNRNGGTPTTRDEWRRAVLGVVRRLTEIPVTRLSSLSMFRDERSRQMMAVVDFGQTEAQEILKRFQELGENEFVKFSRLDELPQNMLGEEEEGMHRNFDSRGGDRNRGRDWDNRNQRGQQFDRRDRGSRDDRQWRR